MHIAVRRLVTGYRVYHYLESIKCVKSSQITSVNFTPVKDVVHPISQRVSHMETVNFIVHGHPKMLPGTNMWVLVLRMWVQTITGQSSAHSQSLVQNSLFPLEKFLKNPNISVLFTQILPLSPLQAGRGQPDVHQIQGGVWEALHEALHQQPPVCLHPAEPEAGRGGSAPRDSHSLPLWVSLPCTPWGQQENTDPACFHSQRDNLFW